LLNNENEPGGSHLIIENIKVIDMNGISQKWKGAKCCFWVIE
jgi:hypothetical protein